MSDVFLLDHEKMDDPDSLRALLSRFEPRQSTRKTDLVAVKIHGGEEGNTAFIRPRGISAVIDALDIDSPQTFLTDTTVLYPGRRMTGPSYVRLAHDHGFGPPATPPMIVADGLRGTDEVYVDLPPTCETRSARIARAITESDVMVVISHFKAHLLSAFGGAIKNLGMGCAARGGKLYQHSSVEPRIDEERCTACAVCAENCPADAIRIDEHATIASTDCIGCGECLQRCPEGAISVAWNQEKGKFMHRMSEYALGATLATEVAVYVNFLTNIAPDCDCMADTGRPLVDDIGVLASTDPVAIDTASLDLVTKAPCPPTSPLAGKAGPGDEKFAALRPHTNGPLQLEHGERIGLGTRTYTLHHV
jgi:hypothetical protein